MRAGVGGQHRMARPYSQDLRDRVVGSVASGRSCRATAALFGVSVASVVKWTQRWRATGSAAAKQMGGWRQLLLTREREWLLARLAEKPDLTLRTVVAELAERGTPASYGAVWRFFKCEGSLPSPLHPLLAPISTGMGRHCRTPASGTGGRSNRNCSRSRACGHTTALPASPSTATRSMAPSGRS